MSESSESVGSAYLEPDSNVFHVPDGHVAISIPNPESAAAVPLPLSLVSGVASTFRSIGASTSLVVSLTSEAGRVRVVDLSNLEADMAEFAMTAGVVKDFEISGNFLLVTDGTVVSVGKISQGLVLIPVVYIADLRRGEEAVEKVLWTHNAPGVFVAMYKSGFEFIDVATAKAAVVSGAAAAGVPQSFTSQVCLGDLKRLSLGGHKEVEAGRIANGGAAPALVKLLRRPESPRKIGNFSKFPLISVSPCGDYLALAFREEAEISVFALTREGVSVVRRFSTENWKISDIAFIEASQVFVAGDLGRVGIFEEGRLIKKLKFPTSMGFPCVKYLNDGRGKILVFALATSASEKTNIMVFEGSRVHIFRPEISEISDIPIVVEAGDGEGAIQLYCRVGEVGNFVTEISGGRFIAEPGSPVYEEISERQSGSVDSEESENSQNFQSQDLERLAKIVESLGERVLAENFRSQLGQVFAKISREKIFPSVMATMKQVNHKLDEHTNAEAKKIGNNLSRISDRLTRSTERAKELTQSLRKQKSEIDQITRNFSSQKAEVANLLKLKLAEVFSKPQEISDHRTGAIAETLVQGAREFFKSGNKKTLTDVCVRSRGLQIPVTPVSRLDEGYLVLYALVKILETSGIHLDTILRVCDFQVDCIGMSAPHLKTSEVVETSHDEVMASLRRLPLTGSAAELKELILRKLVDLTPRYRQQ